MKCNSPHSSIFMQSLFFYCLLGAGHEEHWLFWKSGWTVACLWWCQMTHLYLYVEVQHNCTPTLPHFTFLRGSLLSLWNPSFMSITAGFYSLFDCLLDLESLRSAGMCRISLRYSGFLFYFLEWIKEEVWFAGQNKSSVFIRPLGGPDEFLLLPNVLLCLCPQLDLQLMLDCFCRSQYKQTGP